jgi:hypothetical protein
LFEITPPSFIRTLHKVRTLFFFKDVTVTPTAHAERAGQDATSLAAALEERKKGNKDNW